MPKIEKDTRRGDVKRAKRGVFPVFGRWRAPLALSPEEQYNVSRTTDVWGGAAVISGSAIPVFMVEDLYDEGRSVEDVLGAYGWLSRAEVLQALAYADAYKHQVAADRARHDSAIQLAFGN